MDYLELLSEYGVFEHIPYEELLKTTEWKEIRSDVIQRDNLCCTNCGKTESHKYLNYNISFQIKDRLLSQNVIYLNKSIETVKKELGIKIISIQKFHNYDNRVYGITDKGQLFIVGLNDIQKTSKDDLVINQGITELGKHYFIITKKGQKTIETNYLIPVLSENPVTMHVHHKYYITNKLPWQYDHDALITLCHLCHRELHKKNIIPIYVMINGVLLEMNYTPCVRCHGTGFFPQYKHVEHGICFRCRGCRYEELIPSSKIIK